LLFSVPGSAWDRDVLQAPPALLAVGWAASPPVFGGLAAHPTVLKPMALRRGGAWDRGRGCLLSPRHPSSWAGPARPRQPAASGLSCAVWTALHST